MRKTQAQIQAEIKKLKDLRPRIPALTGFGDDNNAAIDAEIEVLEKDTSEGRIWDKHTDDEHTLNAALYVRRWMDGDEDEAPSVGWRPLCASRRKP